MKALGGVVLLWVAVAAGFIVFAPRAPSASPAPDVSTRIATVDGTAITSRAFDAYMAVFTDPSGKQRATRSQILESLINQGLVHEYAEAHHLSPDASAVAQELQQVNAISDTDASIDRTGGPDAVRDRVVAFLEMEQVQDAVLGPLPSAATAMERRTIQAQRDNAWSEWLEGRRKCAAIAVYDLTTGIGSETPQPTCVDD